MALSEELSQNYSTILKEELVAAMGCTEPIAIAFAAAKAYQELGEIPDHVTVSCSGNIIKNVKGVIVPNSGGQKGIDTAAILGMVGGNASKIQDLALPAHLPGMRESLRVVIPTGFLFL